MRTAKDRVEHEPTEAGVIEMAGARVYPWALENELH